MALFMGGPADGWRIETDGVDLFDIPVNPHPPAFTTDNAVLSASTGPTFLYKRLTSSIKEGDFFFDVYVPLNWNQADVIEHFIMNYKIDKDRERLRYVRTAEGQLYDNDDRIPAGRPYRFEEMGSS